VIDALPSLGFTLIRVYDDYGYLTAMPRPAAVAKMAASALAFPFEGSPVETEALISGDTPQNASAVATRQRTSSRTAAAAAAQQVSVQQERAHMAALQSARGVASVRKEVVFRVPREPSPQRPSSGGGRRRLARAACSAAGEPGGRGCVRRRRPALAAPRNWGAGATLPAPATPWPRCAGTADRVRPGTSESVPYGIGLVQANDASLDAAARSIAQSVLFCVIDSGGRREGDGGTGPGRQGATGGGSRVRPAQQLSGRRRAPFGVLPSGAGP
jgi:hypothetical protein